MEAGPAGASFHLTAVNSGQRNVARDLRCPLGKMFSSFREPAPFATEGFDWFQIGAGASPAGGVNGPGPVRLGPDDDVLCESSLNYFTLYSIGRVKLQWADTLTAHLAFDRSTRTLSIFRHPSFCAANVLRTQDAAVLRKITSRLLPPHHHQGGSPGEPAAVYREVLLSYRLLFGQSPKSRRLVAQFFDRQLFAQQEPSATESPSAPGLDPLLRIICTSPFTSFWRHRKSISALPGTLFPTSVLGLDDQLQEVPTYSVRDDFPVFGQRLLRIQRYSLRQQPSAIRDLWRDRRNPLQWYTFWAVFLVGGVSILLSPLQLSIGAAQLYFAMHPPNTTAGS